MGLSEVLEAARANRWEETILAADMPVSFAPGAPRTAMRVVIGVNGAISDNDGIILGIVTTPEHTSMFLDLSREQAEKLRQLLDNAIEARLEREGIAADAL